MPIQFSGKGFFMSAIAIIGASAKRTKYGNKALRAFLQRGDTVYPIHPAQPEIEGVKAYQSVLDVPGDIDLATFYVSPAVGLRVIEEVAEKGIRRVILNPGAESDELLRRAEELGVEATVACTILSIGRSPVEF
jgi:acyl-CoA synthetase (NDP forming)